MNKKILIAIALTIFLLMNTASAGLFDMNNNNTAAINNENTLVVGIYPVFPPFEYQNDNGTYVGFDIDLAKEVCKRNNWTFKQDIIIDWNSKEFEVNSGEIDCIWGSFTIDGREDKYEFTEPYFNNEQVVVVKSDSNISTLSDLKGKDVEIQEGSSGIDGINNNTTLKESLNSLMQVKDNNIALMDLESGVCDAVVMDIGIANYHINNKYHDDKILNQSISSEKYGVGFKKGNTELRDAVQKTLDEMFKDGTVEKIAQNYSDYNLTNNLIKPN
ncbi:amino acid ABC transporter substrate-binding protein [Methanobrevibacter sp.]|uniref:amino acid ABC transporter substrate-binding protein n=1 Tax=Methanobrevibacter sp. TaxID=66852 RepID=UPI0038910CDC